MAGSDTGKKNTGRKWRLRQEVGRPEVVGEQGTERPEVERLGRRKWLWPAGADVVQHSFASWAPYARAQRGFKSVPGKIHAWR